MAQSNKIKSFKSFSDVLATESASKLAEENKGKRATLSTEITSMLDSMDISSLEGLTEDQKKSITNKLFKEDAKEDKEEEDLVKESKVLNEGTRGQFGKIDKNGNITSVYTHYDSYPDNILPIIKKSYKNVKTVDAVINGGPNSGLEDKLSKINFYNDGSTEMKGTISKIKNYLKDAQDDGGAEYIYLYDESTGEWMMADTYAKTGLVKAFESISIKEATVVMDATDPESKDLAKLLKSNKVTMKVINKQGPSGFPEIELKGKRKDLVSVLSSEDGWDDADLAEYIEESNEELTEEMPAHAKQMKKDGVSDEEIKKMHPEVEDEDLKEAEVNEAKFKIGDKVSVLSKSTKKPFDSGEVTGIQKNGTILINGLETITHEVAIDADLVVKESLVNEAVTIFEKDLADMIKEIKRGYGWIDPESVEDTWENSSNSISFGMVETEIYKRLISAGLLAYAGDDEEEAGKYVKSLKELGIKESVVNEEEINSVDSDEEFKEYATAVLKKAFGEEFDKEKAGEVIKGILTKVDGDYGAAIGMLTSSLGESNELDESCKDGKKHDFKEIDEDGTVMCNHCGIIKS
jgi:hypothetical protein